MKRKKQMPSYYGKNIVQHAQKKFLQRKALEAERERRIADLEAERRLYEAESGRMSTSAASGTVCNHIRKQEAGSYAAKKRKDADLVL